MSKHLNASHHTTQPCSFAPTSGYCMRGITLRQLLAFVMFPSSFCTFEDLANLFESTSPQASNPSLWSKMPQYANKLLTHDLSGDIARLEVHPFGRLTTFVHIYKCTNPEYPRVRSIPIIAFPCLLLDTISMHLSKSSVLSLPLYYLPVDRHGIHVHFGTAHSCPQHSRVSDVLVRRSLILDILRFSFVRACSLWCLSASSRALLNSLGEYTCSRMSRRTKAGCLTTCYPHRQYLRIRYVISMASREQHTVKVINHGTLLCSLHTGLTRSTAILQAFRAIKAKVDEVLQGSSWCPAFVRNAWTKLTDYLYTLVCTYAQGND